MDFKNFLSFERMITPVIIKILFYIGLVGSVIAGVVVFFGGIIGGLSSDGGFGTVLGGLIGGPLIIILGVLVSRIYCELLILFFRMNETLTDIKDLLDKK